MPALRPFTDKALSDLHWSEVVAAWVSRARTEPGARRLKSRPFCGTIEGVRESLAKAAEIEALIAREGFGLPFGGVADIVPMLEHASKGGSLEPADLLAAAGVLKSLARLRAFVQERHEALPLAWTTAMDISDESELARRIEKSFDGNGMLVDDASFELGPLRQRVRGLTKGIQTRLEGYLHDPAFTPHLREHYYSLRNDRYVFPILAQSRSAVPGIVHNASQSGQTLFVEPAPLVAMGNDLAIAQSMVAEEERRILQELSVRLGARLREVSVSVDAAAELDESEASARLSVDLSLNAPEIVGEDEPFRLLAMRHPLLALKKGDRVVPNDLDFDADTRVLVISGPNAGGKTVTLTGLGLCAMMLRAGLPIPAEKGSSLPLFLGVESAVGDDQDLDRDLSTFSAHLAALSAIGQVVSKGTLVLIDELAADTDPKEGAALALAVLEDFAERGARVVITTHLEELKALGMTQRGFVNARVGFDRERLSPTYRLAFGAPGLSSAIDIARRMGLKESVCLRAREVLDQSKGPLGQALADLESSRLELQATRAKLESQRKEVERALVQLKAAQACVKDRARAIEVEERARVVAELDKVRDEVRNAIRRLQKAPDQKGASEAKALVERRLEDQTRQLELKKAQASVNEEERASPSEPLSEGSRVRVPGLGDGNVLFMDGDEAVVALGAMKVRRRAADLVPLNAHGAPKDQQRRFPKSVSKEKRLEAVKAGSIECGQGRLDLRGTRVDEGVRMTDAFLDRCYVEGKLQVTIVHGHGTGQLRAAVTEYLERSPYVESFRFGESNEGGTGATIVQLKG